MSEKFSSETTTYKTNIQNKQFFCVQIWGGGLLRIDIVLEQQNPHYYQQQQQQQQNRRQSPTACAATNNTCI